MQYKYWPILILFCLLLFSGVTAAQGNDPLGPSPGHSVLAQRANDPQPAAVEQLTPSSYITVTSTYDDYSDGFSKTCLNASPCTLRRAINQAHNVDASERPVAIIFRLPLTDSGYLPSVEAWKIQVTGSSSYDLRELYGQTIIDGSSQPGGRTDGPKIIIDGQDTHNIGLILRQDQNELRGLAFQNFEDTHVSIASDNNLVEDCWFGLSDDGMHLSSGDDTEPELDSGLALSASIQGNTIRNNVFTGFKGAAVAIRGDNNVFSGNLIGTRADGTVPLPAQFDQHPCLKGAWVGGSGITVADNNNQIGGPTEAEGNLFAGLFLELSETATQGPAIKVNIGSGHIIQNNVIGLDINDEVIGVCGRGLDFGSGPHGMWVQDNVIVETAMSAILMNGNSLDGNTLRGNIIRREHGWPAEQGDNTFAEDAIAYGPTVPDALRGFTPAHITEVDGTSVSGTSGEGSDCPYCVIELFIDNKDAVTETLQSVAVVTATDDGSWTATLPAPLESTQGLRTMSTVPDTFTIIGLDTGTTSNLSRLYANYQVYQPLLFK
ncbi:MAG: hypothetical protein JXA37_08785 [Chloroflexia bacterium]|nr:hypothetical protein [Chloroflexia bacterium]